MSLEYTDLFQEQERDKPSNSGKCRRHGARQEIRIRLKEVPISKNVWETINGLR